MPKPPKYKDSTTGRFMLNYTKQAILKGNKLSGTNIVVKTSKQNINEIRILPNSDKTYTIEVVYTVADVPKKENNGKIASIDLGLNNLMTIGSNAAKPIIINGKPLKSINQYYNKKNAYLQSKLRDNKKTSKRIQKLTSKRNNKINDYLHKATTLVINYLVSNDITTLIVGYNKEWKQRINIGSKNNQNFVGIPFLRVIEILEYKCELKGITLTKTEESYTSKTSFLDNEMPKKQESYLGRRVKRGLFKSASGKAINADLNASLQIMKKVVPNAFSNGIEGFVVSPTVITVK
jgi:putative transposase